MEAACRQVRQQKRTVSWRDSGLEQQNRFSVHVYCVLNVPGVASEVGGQGPAAVVTVGEAVIV